MSNLKPCPFCGHDPVLTRGKRAVTIACDNNYCLAEAYASAPLDEEIGAVVGWNRRADTTTRSAKEDERE